MRIIFSRKGFDATYGGCPSPIIGGKPYSLPIPTGAERSVTRFQDIQIANIAVDERDNFIKTLTRGRVLGEHFCHLDPDIYPDALPRKPHWKGALGQVGAAASHLRNQDVSVGDIFLFFGWFRRIDSFQKPRFVGGHEHRVFGWLQIGEIIDLGGDGSHVLRDYPWLVDHPHVRPGWDHVNRNILYVASDSLSIAGEEIGLPGSGVLLRGFTLTARQSSRRGLWQLPEFFDPNTGGIGISRHQNHRWNGSGLLYSAPIGQEFVANLQDMPQATKWLRGLLLEEDQRGLANG